MVLKGDAMYAAVSDSPNNKATLKYIKRVDKDSLAIGMTNYIMISSTNSIEKAYYGDVNGDGEINIADATAIQKEIESINSDVNFDSDITVIDATTVQSYIVGLM